MAETRRRGEELEDAILDAAWTELIDRGYSGMSFESVAERAHTSKTVLYRRWPTKEALMIAAVGHRGIMRPTTPPDTGNLRDDVVTVLKGTNRIADSMPGLISSVLGSYFAETGVPPATMRAMVFGGGQTGMEKLVDRAVERGELPSRLPPRLTSLPVDLFRHELFMTFEPVSDETIVEIVDTMFMPLVADYVRRSEGRQLAY